MLGLSVEIKEDDEGHHFCLYLGGIGHAYERGDIWRARSEHHPKPWAAWLQDRCRKRYFADHYEAIGYIIRLYERGCAEGRYPVPVSPPSLPLIVRHPTDSPMRFYRKGDA